MANIEQTVKDTHELLNLVSETVVENSENLTAVDTNMNKLGGDVVKLHETAEAAKSGIDKQNQSIEDVRENQEIVKESNIKLVDGINQTLNSFGESEQSLEDIKEKLDAQKEKDIENHSEVLEKLDLTNTEYANNVKSFESAVTEVSDKIETLDVHEKLENVLESLGKIVEKQRELEDRQATNNTTNTDKLTKITDEINSAVERMSVLSTETDELKSDFLTSIARMKNIDVKLEAILDEGDITTPELSFIEDETEDTRNDNENEVE